MNKQLTVQIGGKEIYMIIFVRNWYIQYINYTIFGVMKNNISFNLNLGNYPLIFANEIFMIAILGTVNKGIEKI